MKPATDNLSIFERYATRLTSIDGVSAKLEKGDAEERWVFTPTRSGALKTTLSYHVNDPIAGEISLDIDGTDCAYWHTEEADLEYYVTLAEAALKGEVAYNTSRFFKFKEICFKVGDKWECTRVRDDNASFHYTKTRRKITQPLNTLDRKL